MDYNQRFVVLDIETTGLNYEYFDEPTEIALIEIENGKLTGNNKHYYLKPYKKVTLAFLEKVFGKKVMKETDSKDLKSALSKAKELNNEDLINEVLEAKEMAKNMLSNIEKGKSKYTVLPEVRKFIGDSIVIAHNAQFDINFLNNYFVSLNLATIDKYICTFKSFKEHFNFKHNTLKDCCDYYHLEFNGAHNALEDTDACARLFIEETKDFPDDILYFEFSKLESYANFKKRVLNSTYFSLTKKMLEDTSFVNENIEVDKEIEDICYNSFYNFKKPIEISKEKGIDLYTTESLFIKWINCININKHLGLIKEKYLTSYIKETLNYCNRDFNQIRELNLLMFGSEPNYFFYRLYDKLENRKNEMEYTLEDFNYYFDNMYSFDDIDKKIGKGFDYICDNFIEWLLVDDTRINNYKVFIKDNYNKRTKLGISLTKHINNSKNDKLLKLTN